MARLRAAVSGRGTRRRSSTYDFLRSVRIENMYGSQPVVAESSSFSGNNGITSQCLFVLMICIAIFRDCEL